MKGTAVFLHVKMSRKNYVGVGRNEEQAKSDLYNKLYNKYSDRKVDSIEFSIDELMRVFYDLPESVLFYLSFSYNGETIDQDRIDKLKDEHENMELSGVFGDDWRQRLREQKLSYR